MMFGQLGIRLRAALVEGHWAVAAELVPTLDREHRIELLLGAALRDGRQEFAAAHLFCSLEKNGGDWGRLCWMLGTGEPDRRLDLLAASYVAERRVPDRWIPLGRGVESDPRAAALPDVEVARQYAGGVGGLALLACFEHAPLYPAVQLYYGEGNIHALGPRPMLVMAASEGGITTPLELPPS